MNKWHSYDYLIETKTRQKKRTLFHSRQSIIIVIGPTPPPPQYLIELSKNKQTHAQNIHFIANHHNDNIYIDDQFVNSFVCYRPCSIWRKEKSDCYNDKYKMVFAATIDINKDDDNNQRWYSITYNKILRKGEKISNFFLG